MNALVKSAKKLWLSSKSAVLIFGAFMIGLGLWFLLRGKDVDPWEILNEQKKSHAQELEAINAANEELSKRNAAIDENLKKTLREIDEKYAKENRELDKKTKKEIEKIVKDTSLSPEELAKKLAAATGLSLDE